MKNKKFEDKKNVMKAIKHAFKKMRTNDDMVKEFIEFLEKWGCINV